jgi:hypothetical protein
MENSTPPTPVTPGGSEGAPRFYAASEWYPGMQVVQASGGESAQQVSFASEMAPGVQAVYVLGGFAQDAIRRAWEQAAALAAARRQPGEGTAQAQDGAPLLVTILLS